MSRIARLDTRPLRELIRAQITFRNSMLAGIVLALFFVATAIIGITLSYSPVPFWDMWGGTLGFYLAHLDGDISIWWGQHNEHRIILSRIFFWLDFKLAGGSGILLLAMHPLLIAMAVYIFYLFSLQLFKGHQYSHQIGLLCATALTGWLFLWMQHENLAWAFQSQFFMAQSIPLLALYLLARSTASVNHRTLWFSAACIAGIASAGTMANGIICLPLMLVYSVLTRQSWPQALALAILCVVTLGLYFTDYQSPQTHGSVLGAMLEQPIDLARYVLLYLGTPFYFLLGGGGPAMMVASLATAIMAAASIYYLITALITPTTHADSSGNKIWQLALVFYIIYLAGTALGTGGGRLTFGLHQALTLRYTTPALMAWGALFLLALPDILRAWRYARYVVIPSTVLLLALMITQQLGALESKAQQRFERSVAALALELDIKDEPGILAVYEMSDGLFNVSNLARMRRLSVFNQYPWKGLREQVGDFYRVPLSLPTCQGSVDVIRNIEDETDYLMIQGWLFDQQTQSATSLIRIIDHQNIVSGFALSGQPREDVAAAVSKHASNSGFAGYTRIPEDGGSIRLVMDDNSCELGDIQLTGGSAGEIN